MQLSDFTPVTIGKETYFEQINICQVLRISRQSLHTWRRNQRVPQGRILRGKRVLFTAPEVEQIIAYAERIEPADVTAPTNQMKLALKL